MRSANPALSDSTFRDLAMDRSDGSMTIQGTVNKTMLLLVILLIPASYVWHSFFNARIAETAFSLGPYMAIGGIGGFIFAMITIFKKTWAPVTAPIYAGLEGLLLGALSATFEMQYEGIVIQAVALTVLTLFSLLFAYKSKMIAATENFKLGVAAATGGIFLVYLLTFILSFFGVSVPYIHDSGPVGILFSLFVVVIAALNLVMDFDFIENGEEMRAPKYMEWYAAFGLVVTLIWLYIEFLRLLAKLRSRD